MAKRSSNQTGEEQVVDQSVGSDYDSIIAELKAQLEAKSTEVETLKASKPAKAAKTPKGPKAVAPTRTLESVIAAQMETPRLYALKRLAVAVKERQALGQSRDEALQQVMDFYASVTSDILDEIEAGVHEGKDVEGAILAHLSANYPKVMSGHPRGPKAKKSESDGSDNASDSDESGISEEATVEA